MSLKRCVLYLKPNYVVKICGRYHSEFSKEKLRTVVDGKRMKDEGLDLDLQLSANPHYS